jgi:hypothetical protein
MKREKGEGKNDVIENVDKEEARQKGSMKPRETEFSE